MAIIWVENAAPGLGLGVGFDTAAAGASDADISGPYNPSIAFHSFVNDSCAAI